MLLNLEVGFSGIDDSLGLQSGVLMLTRGSERVSHVQTYLHFSKHRRVQTQSLLSLWNLVIQRYLKVCRGPTCVKDALHSVDLARLVVLSFIKRRAPVVRAKIQAGADHDSQQCLCKRIASRVESLEE